MNWTWDRFVNGDDPRIFHFTHVDNLPSLVEAGELMADCVVRKGERSVVEVGNQDIKASRRGRRVPVEPGGVVGEYVPFYYAPRSPMLFQVAHSYHIQGQQIQDQLVYLVSRVSTVAGRCRVVATDRNAALLLAEFAEGPEGVAKMIDWPLMRQVMWNSTEERPDRKERRMAELLVHRGVPVDCITGLVTRTQDTADVVRDHVAGTCLAELRLLTCPDWYFDERGW
ncbi:DUF4433 domain-containing protein [Allokutzneria sp. NRRL B-24872]|uniref:type II toxin-antitoxin system toxin DNA ADP-ribosyl transferase DarT n=1 Tax=Allokutzneria sp. NRRL B-24872 TaxID=1137961 RepID=UPI00143D7BAA|nr:DUF4433 domain-containing protein [Allokutzneria sp. NRRL B-24872]